MVVYMVRAGTDTREFTSIQQFRYWIGVLLRRGIVYRVEYRFEKGSKQLEFAF